jgi:hypothetical protein
VLCSSVRDHNDGQAGCQHSELRGGHLGETVAGETTSRARAAAKTPPLIKQTFAYNGGLATFICSNALSPLLTCSWHALARKWVADPILDAG